MNQLSIDKLKERLTELQEQFDNVNTRLQNATLSDESIRALMKTKNELYADIQSVNIEISSRTKPLMRSLNESLGL